ncbi:metal ABC transporter substrate-binding protein, partial [Frankia sp. EI5c]|uniref:metal ABC transporter substrate-binding protein n=2 Tax=Frankia sp. EI5c TaxID=683316 RepID=UPI001F5BB44C
MIVAAVLGASASLAACGGSGGGSGTGGGTGAPRVVATTAVAADFARAIGGDGIEITQLLRPGVDPHDYDPPAADLEALAAADLLIENGVWLEGWLAEAVSASGVDGTRVVMAEGVLIRHGAAAEEHGDDHGEERGDPHIWYDPRNAKIMVANIERGLVAV